MPENLQSSSISVHLSDIRSHDVEVLDINSNTTAAEVSNACPSKNPASAVSALSRMNIEFVKSPLPTNIWLKFL